MRRRIDTLRDVGRGSLPGAPVRVFLRDGTDLGVAHVPWPVSPGDLFALERGLPLRVRTVEPAPPGELYHATLEVFPERRHLFRRGERRSPPPELR
jgi:hypothetical protein